MTVEIPIVVEMEVEENANVYSLSTEANTNEYTLASSEAISVVKSSEWGEITGTITDQTDLVEYVAENGGKIDSISVNGTEQTISNKNVDITVPTKTSDLTNDSGYITDAGVTSFNGNTGAVTYTAPVTSVNGSTGDVTVSVPTKTTARGDGNYLYNGQTVEADLTGTGFSTSNNLLNSGYTVAIRANSTNPFLGLLQGGAYKWYAQAANGYFYFGPTSTNALRLDQTGNGVFQTGSVTATKIIKSGGTSSQFLKADGSVDSNTYLTSVPVTSINGETGAVVLDASDVGALPDTTSIPTKTSDLTNDSGYITSSSVPTATSELTNDSGFITSTQAPVQSVNGNTGTVTLDASDVGALEDTAQYALGHSQGGNAVRTNAILYGIVDSTSTATAFTATIDGVTEYYDGLAILLKNGVVTSASGFTININGLGAKHAYTNMAAASAETTVFNVAYTMLFIYDSTRVDGGGWICYRGYDSNTNTIGYQLRTNSMTMAASGATYRYRLLFTSADGTKFVPANTSSSTNATSSRTVNQTPIDAFGRIVYYGYTTAISAGNRPGATYLWDQYVVTLGYSFNRTGAALTLTTYLPVYVKASPQTDGSAIIDATTPYVQALPTSKDGYIYIYLGVATSATAIELVPNHPVYFHDGTGLRKWQGYPIS